MSDLVKVKECPICGKEYHQGMHAISRKDNKTEICSYCGLREAMEWYADGQPWKDNKENADA